MKKTAAEVVTRVTDTLGAKLTAYMANTVDPKDIAKWQQGEGFSLGQLRRLVIADEAISRLTQAGESKKSIQALFQGMWPELNDEMPAVAIRSHKSLRTVRQLISCGIADLTNGR